MPGENMPELAALMERLRAPDGCPWDREQNHDTLKIYLIEEAYEVLEAIEAGRDDKFKEELGDLLLQVVFHAQIAREESRFTLNDVIRGIHDKLVRRHPHVFGDADLKTSGEVLRNWEAIKAAESGVSKPAADGAPKSILDGAPRGLSALAQANQLTSRAARVGFDWKEVEDIFDKLQEETVELRESLQDADRNRMADELGDLLFVIVNLARRLHVDPDLALKRTNEKFMTRFRYVEQRLREAGRTLQEATLEEMDGYWRESKQRARIRLTADKADS